MTDQVFLFFGLLLAFVAGAAVVWLILRKAGEGHEVVALALRDSLREMQDRLQKLEVAREGANASLREQIQSLAASEVQLQKETARLSGALRAPAVRGRWGEMQLRRVVELAGMSEACDFEEQSRGDVDGSRMRPDLIVRLPNARTLVIDAKTPLSAYLESSEANDESVRAAKLKEHAAQVRQQIVRLSAKSYWDQFEDSPEFVVLFLPGEAFFSAALMAEPELLEYAADRRVILATPTTLIALLKAVAFGWRQQRAAERAEEIREIGASLYERLRSMASELSLLGGQLERTVQSYNRVLGGWESRVLPGSKRMNELGAGTGNPLEAPRQVETPVRTTKVQ
ncbi:MAG: DNA recombination protein RmuC [Candidatus Solibacter usitatus]|nr:DNA recombination protein RmuC [Candidatus Solibacter usitatus]